MNDPAAQEETLSSNQESAQQLKPASLPCSMGHQLLTLVGLSFVFFEIIFIDLYSDKFWFSLNIEWLGLPCILLAAAIAHCVLVLMETRFASVWLRFFAKGNPPAVYRKWLQLEDSGVSFGLHHVQWQVIDELTLTWLGNMHIKSRTICGQGTLYPDIVLRFPFGVASQEDQKLLVRTIQKYRPQVRINARLEQRLASPIVKGQNLIQFITAALMAVLLLDVGINSFHWLEMLKHYHLARQNAIDGKLDEARKELAAADHLRDTEIPYSYANSAFLKKGLSAAGVLEARSDALMDMKQYDLAIEDSQKSINVMPENFRLYLHLARQLQHAGKTAQAQDTIETAIHKHKDSLLPRFYLVSTLWKKQPSAARTAYKSALDEVGERFFAPEPFWPPGNNRYVADPYYEVDVHYIFDKILGVKDNDDEALTGSVSTGDKHAEKPDAKRGDATDSSSRPVTKTH